MALLSGPPLLPACPEDSAPPRQLKESPKWLRGQESTCQGRSHRRHRLDPGSGRAPRNGHGDPLQYPCLMTPWTEGLVSYSPWGRKASHTTERLLTHTHTHTHTHVHAHTCTYACSHLKAAFKKSLPGGPVVRTLLFTA